MFNVIEAKKELIVLLEMKEELLGLDNVSIEKKNEINGKIVCLEVAIEAMMEINNED